MVPALASQAHRFDMFSIPSVSTVVPAAVYVPDRAHARGTFAAHCHELWRTTGAFVVAVAALVLGSYALRGVDTLLGLPHLWAGPVGWEWYTSTAAAFFPFQAAVWTIRALWTRRVAYPRLEDEGWRRAWRRAIADFRREELAPARVASALVVCALFPLMMATFTGWKVGIPAWRGDGNPFPWDVTLSALDRTLHGGVDPWRWLQPVVGRPWSTLLLGYAYGPGWMALLTGSVLVTAWDRDERRRSQMLVASVLLWGVVGGIGGGVLASAGPCFAPLASGDDRYGPLLAYLRVMSSEYFLPVLEAQRYLWETYQRDGAHATSAGAGISAMPSMHVGLATLAACYGWRRSRACGAWLTGFVVVTMVGSVHFAFHYAVDGYVAVVATVICWQVAGRLTAPEAVAAATRQDELVVVRRLPWPVLAETTAVVDRRWDAPATQFAERTATPPAGGRPRWAALQNTSFGDAGEVQRVS